VHEPLTEHVSSIHTACDFYTSTGDFGIRFRVTLNGQVIIPLQGACPICAASDPNGPPYCQGGAVYETATATFTSPASTGINSLVIEVTQASGLTGQQVPLLMDGIFLNPVGNTDMTDPSVTS
jgi:hypothetical protein